MIVSPDPWAPITSEQWAALRAAWPNGARLTAAWRLARDVETLGSLLGGEAVLASSLNDEPLVRLERVSPADLFEIHDAA